MPWWILTVKRRWVWMNSMIWRWFKYQIWMNVEEYGPISLVSFGYLYLHMLHSLWVCSVLIDLSEPRRSRIAQLSEHVDRGKDRLAGIILGGSRDQSVKLYTSQLWNSPWMSRTVNNQKITCTMDEFTQTNCGLQFGVIFLISARKHRTGHLRKQWEHSKSRTTWTPEHLWGSQSIWITKHHHTPTRPNTWHHSLEQLQRSESSNSSNILPFWTQRFDKSMIQWCRFAGNPVRIEAGEVCLEKRKNLRIFKLCFDFSMKNDYLQSRSFEGRVIGAFHPE